MKRTIVLILLSLGFCSLKAQSDLRDGYIISNSGDTVYGKIDFKGNLSNARHCFFKTDSLSALQEYLPSQLRAYRFTNSKYYISREIQSDSGIKQVFLECLISGKVSIYYILTDTGDKFYIEKDSNLNELTNNEVKYEEGGAIFSRNSNKYIGLLQYYMNDCPELAQQIKNTGFDKKSLIKISRNYHEKVCPDKQCIIYEKKIPKVKFHYGILLGGGLQRMDYSFTGNSYSFFTGNSKLNCQFDIFTRINLREKERPWLQLNLGYNFASYNLKHVYNNLYREYYDIDYKYNCLTTELSFGYRFSILNKLPFISLGIPVRYILKENGTCTNSHNFTYNFDNSGAITAARELKAEAGLFGYNLGVGLEFKLTHKAKYFVSANYEKLRTLTAFSFSTIKINTGLYF